MKVRQPALKTCSGALSANSVFVWGKEMHEPRDVIVGLVFVTVVVQRGTSVFGGILGRPHVNACQVSAKGLKQASVWDKTYCYCVRLCETASQDATSCGRERRDGGVGGGWVTT